MTGTAKSAAREASIEVFRWVCITAVVVQHSVFQQRQTPEFAASVVVAKEVFGWCVVGFFFLSGWFSRPEEFGLRSVGKRFRRLIVPYLAINALIGAIMYVLANVLSIHLNGGEKWTLEVMTYRLLFLQGLGPQLYFLPFLFLIWTAMVFSFRLLGRTWGTALWIAVAVLVYSTQGLPEAAYGPNLDRLPLYCLAVALGMALSTGSRTFQASSVAVLALTGIGLAWSGRGTAILHLSVSIGLFFAIRGFYPASLSTWATRWSAGAVFLWHAPFVHPLSSLIWYKLLGPQDGWFSFGLCFATTYVVCILIDRLVRLVKLDPWLSL